jgi:hypothetical protein
MASRLTGSRAGDWVSSRRRHSKYVRLYTFLFYSSYCLGFGIFIAFCVKLIYFPRGLPTRDPQNPIKLTRSP